jgi:hypothetical protein
MEKVMNLAAFGRLGLYWFVVLLTAGMYLAIGVPGSATAAAYKSKQIRVEYVPPKNPAHQPIYERLKQARALERIQTLLSNRRQAHGSSQCNEQIGAPRKGRLSGVRWVEGHGEVYKINANSSNQ